MGDQDLPPFVMPPTLYGDTYPTGSVIAVFADEAHVDAARTALEAAGIPPADIVRLDGQTLVRNERIVRARRGLGDRLIGLFPSDERGIIKDYIALGEEGRWFLGVHVPQLEQCSPVRDTLAAHGGSHMHYYGANTVTDL